ncbi:NAD(P)-binding protein [Trametopsis cervina]|nr:NAD(P)-binding protein [Trametopsis cervina]
MGTQFSVVAQMFPPKPKWGVNDIPDLSGKVMIVTGGNTGVGKETVKALLAKNAKVYIATRNKEKSLSTIQDLQRETGKEALFLPLDLADLKSVKASAEEFLSKENKLHVLFNNAGVMEYPIEQLTAQGYDMTFGVNVIGHWYFTELLMPALIAATVDGERARVVTTSSSANYLETLHWDTFTDTPQRRKMRLDALYNQSKHGNVVVARELARRYADKGVVSISVNPGNLRTELQRNLVGVKKFIISQILYPAPMGALTQLYAGTDPHAAELNGEFLIPWARLGKARKETGDPAIGKKLWEWLEEQTRAI